jgi:hypothetical protein
MLVSARLCRNKWILCPCTIHRIRILVGIPSYLQLWNIVISTINSLLILVPMYLICLNDYRDNFPNVRNRTKLAGFSCFNCRTLTKYGKCDTTFTVYNTHYVLRNNIFYIFIVFETAYYTKNSKKQQTNWINITPEFSHKSTIKFNFLTKLNLIKTLISNMTLLLS